MNNENNNNKFKITYHKEGDYLIPNLIIEEQPNINIGKYGRARLNYIKNYNKGFYEDLMINGKITSHLAEIDKIANKRVKEIVESMAKADNTPLHYDGKMNQLTWVGLMNNYKNCAEEIVYKKLINN